MRRYHLLVIATSMLLGVGLLVFDFLTLPKISEATSPNNSQRRETSVAVNPPNMLRKISEASSPNTKSQHIETSAAVNPSSSAPPNIGVWQIMPAEDATSHGVELNPTTYICACAKCGSTSLYSELFAIVHGRSFASMNYTGPPWIHNLANQKLWKNIQAKRLVDDWPEYDEFKKHGSFALIRDPRERLLSAWHSRVSCVEKENRGHKHLVRKLLKLAGPIDNVTARTDLGFPCLDLYLSVLSQIHTQANEGLLDIHLRPQHLGCFKDIPPSMWTVVTAIADPNARCSLKSVLLKNSHNNSLDATDDSGCLMMKSHGRKRKDNNTLTNKDEVLLDQITRREYEMLIKYLHAPDASVQVSLH